MKKIFFSLCAPAMIFVACNSTTEATTKATAEGGSAIELPYKADYTSQFTDDVPDADLLAVMNSYKAWESGDMQALRATMGDRMMVNESAGLAFNGPTDSLMKIWSAARDSLSSVTLKMDVWRKNHSVTDSANYITVWYKEIDVHKSGKIDSANYADVNRVKDGKVTWYSQFKQAIK